MKISIMLNIDYDLHENRIGYNAEIEDAEIAIKGLTPRMKKMVEVEIENEIFEGISDILQEKADQILTGE